MKLFQCDECLEEFPADQLEECEFGCGEFLCESC